MSSKFRMKTLQPRRGAVAVEMALTLPILLLLLFAVIEIGRANMVRHAAESAAYEGARAGILPGATAEEARDAARRILDTVGVTNFQMTVTPDPISGNAEQVEVSIRVPLDQNMTAARLVSGLEFTGECTLSRELVSDLQ